MQAFIFSSVLYFLLSFFLVNASPTDTVKMQLSWKHQFQFAGYYAALEKGFYSDEGLTVELIEGGPGMGCNEKTLQTQVQYCNGSGSIVKQRLEGEALVVLASFVQHSPAVLITLKESGLLTPQDLIGKRVETLSAGVPILEINAMFHHAGVSLGQLDNRENSAGIDALVSRQVDAKYAHVTNEPYLLESLGVDYHIISPRDYGIDFYGEVLFTNEAELKNYPQRADKFLQASIKGWEYTMTNKSEIAQLIVNKYPTGKTYQALIAEAMAIEKLMLRDLIEVGHINENRWRATTKTLMLDGLVDKDSSLDGFIYHRQAKQSYVWLFKLLLVCLFIAVVISLVLWWRNRAMSAEIKIRTEAQHFLRLANQQIREQAYTDELSGMGNRRAFYEEAEASIKLAKLDNASLVALLIDIDNFKSINDYFGHGVGDKVIQKLAEVILNIIREKDVQGRIGGEEFGIMTSNTDLKGAEGLAERLRLEVEALEVVSDYNVIRLTVSIGIAAFRLDSDDVHTLLERADNALYKAKKLGRNQIVVNA